MSATTQSKTPPAAERLEKELINDFPTPELVQTLIDKELIDQHSLSRIVIHLAYYALRDTSDLARTKSAIARLISFLSQAENFIKGAIESAFLSDLESLVADAMKQKSSLN